MFASLAVGLIIIIVIIIIIIIIIIISDQKENFSFGKPSNQTNYPNSAAAQSPQMSETLVY